MILRNFLYLDTDSVDNYLSTIDGYIVEGPVDQTSVTKGTRGGSLGISKVVEFKGAAGSESSAETKQRVSITPQARFQRLYEALEEQKSILLLDAVDPGTIDQYRRGEVVEVEASVTIPNIFLATDGMSDFNAWHGFFSEWGDVFGMEGGNPLAGIDPGQVKAMTGMSELFARENVPLLFTARSTASVRFAAALPRKYLSARLRDLQGDVAIFGRVQRVISKGEVYEFPLVSASLAMPAPNRAERRRTKGKNAGGGMVEKLKGPGLILDPIAIYR